MFMKLALAFGIIFASQSKVRDFDLRGKGFGAASARTKRVQYNGNGERDYQIGDGPGSQSYDARLGATGPLDKTKRVRYAVFALAV